MPVFPDSTVAAYDAYLKCKALVKNWDYQTAHEREPSYLRHSSIAPLMQKDAVTSVNGPELLPSPVVIEMIKTQKQHTLFGTALADRAFVRIPFDVRAAASSSLVSGSVLTAGEMIPVSSFEIAAKTLQRRHANALSAVTKELIERGGADAITMLNTLLSDSLALAIDEVLLSDIQDDPATLELTLTDSTAEDFRLAFVQMLLHVNIRGAGPLYWVCSRAAANHMLFDTIVLQGLSPQGGTLMGIPVIVSDGLIDASDGGTLMLIDSGKIAANVESLRTDTSESAALQMTDDPSGDPAQTVSMFQTNSVAIRSTLTWGAELLSNFKAASLTGIE